ncbi:uncharacterized protein GGS22DRAFT_194747 [Annulohypoxylon maeteangense]|uniref:uncharacterized protein n=1 Tax=Annulohypoxylon maeteangense TaxID=1927788 RepID=UPI00200758E9|nr:uncharacterized protein GGS22DRAFT_194747 [Annulohypoxylon maeteangense]KAI0884145.1 hypothetical protein GGS22DRAFT_194747 [Annulohypoxylon maeteangense]
MLKADQLLLKARERVSKTTYKFVNKETGCYGVAERAAPRRRPNLTIHHNERCECVDIPMKTIARHAHVMFNRKCIRRGRRDDLTVAIKLRLPNVGIRVKIPRSTKRINPEEVDEKPLRVVEEALGGQLLVEVWDTPEAWRKRTIWKDW